MSSLRTWTIGALLALSALVPAASTSASAGDGDIGERLRLACLRIPTAQTRVSTLITRLEGPADVKGSLAWFRARIAEATSANHPLIAQDLQHRLDFLTARLVLLHQQQDRLGRAADHCRSRGVAI